MGWSRNLKASNVPVIRQTYRSSPPALYNISNIILFVGTYHFQNNIYFSTAKWWLWCSYAMFVSVFSTFLGGSSSDSGAWGALAWKIKSSSIESTYNGSGERMVLIMFFRAIHSLPPINNVTYVEILLCSLKYFTSVL